MNYDVYARERKGDPERFNQSFTKRASAKAWVDACVWRIGFYEASLRTETGRTTYTARNEPVRVIVNGEPALLNRNRAYLKTRDERGEHARHFDDDATFRTTHARAKHAPGVVLLALTAREVNEWIDRTTT